MVENVACQGIVCECTNAKEKKKSTHDRENKRQLVAQTDRLKNRGLLIDLCTYSLDHIRVGEKIKYFGEIREILEFNDRNLELNVGVTHRAVSECRSIRMAHELILLFFFPQKMQLKYRNEREKKSLSPFFLGLDGRAIDFSPGGSLKREKRVSLFQKRTLRERERERLRV